MPGWMADAFRDSEISVIGSQAWFVQPRIQVVRNCRQGFRWLHHSLLGLRVYDSAATTPFGYAISKARAYSSVTLHGTTVHTLPCLLQQHLNIKMLKLIRHLISKWKVIILSQNFIPITFFFYYTKWIKSSTKHWEIKQSIRSSLNIIEIGAIKSISHGWVII